MDLESQGTSDSLRSSGFGYNTSNGQEQFNPLHGVITQYRIDCGWPTRFEAPSRTVAIFRKDFAPTRALFERLGVPKQIGARPNRSYTAKRPGSRRTSRPPKISGKRDRISRSADR